MALRELGIPIGLYSLKRPDPSIQQPEAAALAGEVHYVPGTLSGAVLCENVRFLLGAPLTYLGTFMWLVREWWRDRRVADLWAGDTRIDEPLVKQFGLKARLRWVFNRSDLTYLLKSLWLVLPAVYLGRRLQERGIIRLHAHWASYPTTVALVIRRLFGIPFSFSAHAYDVHVVARLLPAKLRMAEFVVTCAEYNAGYLRVLAGAEAGKRISVNYHGVDLERFKPEGRLGALRGDLPRIVTCGRLQLYKGHQFILRACARLKRPVQCVVIGEGPQRQDLAELAAKLGIAARVEFTGPLPQVEVVRILGGADVFVLASILLGQKERRDVIPNVLLEAMAMELPVVATRISGVGELITNGVNGRLVPQGDADALAAVLEELLGDRAQRNRLGTEARRTVAAGFDRRKNVLALARLFDEEPIARSVDTGSENAGGPGEPASGLRRRSAGAG